MSKDIKIEAITDMETDFAQWYTDVVKKAELIDYSPVRGCMVLRPYGYAIWELIQKELDSKFKESGHENVYMPLFIPESLLQKEKDHVEGFAPECAVVTIGGQEPLNERLIVRPTSETLFCDHYANIIESYRDLPKLYNQWCSVVRWEKNTRPFLRTMEFLWQEGHTAHETAEEAEAETLKILDIYSNFYENILAIPVIKGRKTEREKFAGAKSTYTVESMMHDKKALQGGTSHNFGDGFAKTFGIQFTDKNNKLQYAHQTSWGVSTRMIGGIIMVHGDNNGLVLPPNIAPIQLIVVPIAMHKEGVLDKAKEIKERLSFIARVSIDESDKSPGWKFSEAEMKGIPLRLEIGPKDIEKGQCVLVRRDNREKYTIQLSSLENEVSALLIKIQKDLFAKAKKHLDSNIRPATSIQEFESILNEETCFIKTMWCGDGACELEIKEKTSATSRCMPFEQEELGDVCVCCGKPANKMVIWGKAY
ncbi:MAG: proline--tRNA ligase [Clostridiales bacterium]|jgi:prolyl-tRNA synthetase|nr:proline--tRNA ligase [Clostridiales bacterium]